MSPLWLFLIIPLSFTFGYSLCGALSENSEIERCERCQYRKKDKGAS